MPIPERWTPETIRPVIAEQAHVPEDELIYVATGEHGYTFHSAKAQHDVMFVLNDDDNPRTVTMERDPEILKHLRGEGE